VRKVTTLSLHVLKMHNKKKTICGNTVAIHNVLKKKNYKAKFLTILILKK
jgi:hypothetical protein